MRPQALYLLALVGTTALAQQTPGEFPRAAVRFVEAELSEMAVAVAAKDRSFFVGRTDRAQQFLKTWGLGTNEAAIEAYPMCLEAVTDYLIVGLCQISPPGSICEPSTFVPKFEKNLEECRRAAGPNPSVKGTSASGLRPLVAAPYLER